MSVRFSNKDSFHLTTFQADRLTALSAGQGRSGKTAVELVSQIVEMGLFQLEYRTKRNKQQAQLKKVGRLATDLINKGNTLTVVDKLKLAQLLGMASVATVGGAPIDDSDDDIVSVE